jgi:hypothetical protein
MEKLPEKKSNKTNPYNGTMLKSEEDTSSAGIFSYFDLGVRYERISRTIS